MSDAVRLEILTNAAVDGLSLVTRANQVKKHSQTVVGPALGQVGSGSLLIDDVVIDLASTDETALDKVRQFLLPPHMDHVDDIIVLEDQSVDIFFDVFDFETALEDVVVTAQSSDSNLLLDENIRVQTGPTPEFRAVNISSIADRSGVVVVTLTVSDADGFELSRTVTLTVPEVNDAPTFTPGPLEVASRNDHSVDVNWASDISAGTSQEDANGQRLEFQLTIAPGGETLFETLPMIDAETGRLSFVPKRTKTGLATVTVALLDNGGTENGGQDTSDPFTFTIAIAPSTTGD